MGTAPRGSRTARAFVCGAVLTAVSAIDATGDGAGAPKITITAPARGAWVGAKFAVRGTLAGAPKDAVVRLGDQTVKVGADGAFEFQVAADREGERPLRVSFTPSDGPAIAAEHVVKVDATPPAIGAIQPAADRAEYAGDAATVSGRFIDLTSMTLRVNGASTPIDAGGRFSASVPVAADGETVVRIEVTDAAGNAAPAVVRTLVRWKARGAAAMSLEEAGAFWIARDGTRVAMMGDARADAGAIVAQEKVRGPLAPEDRALEVEVRGKGVAAPAALRKALAVLIELPARVSVAASALDPSLSKLKSDAAEIVADPMDGSCRVRCAEKEWAFTAADIRALTARAADAMRGPAGRKFFDMAGQLRFARQALIIRARMPEPVDARFLAMLVSKGFEGADLILDSGAGPGASGAPTVPPPVAPAEPGVPGGPAAPPGPVKPELPPKAAVAQPALLKRGAFNSLKSADQAAITAALTWLVAHQSVDGLWSAKEAVRWCDGKARDVDVSRELGRPFYDVGVTGLALLALVGGGHSQTERGPYGAAITSAVRALAAVQDAEGCYGARTTGHYVYCHAIATLAMVEAFGVSNDPVCGASAQKGLDFISLARNPYFAWRYGIKPGDNDTSVTGWMIGALEAARRVNAGAAVQRRPAPFFIDEDAFDGARSWVEKMIDPATGRAGYQQRGTGPARPMALVDTFPSEESEAMTAIAMLVRLDCAKVRAEVFDASFETGMNLLWRVRPSAGVRGRDMYYWYYGAIVMRVAGKKYAAMAKDWDAGIKVAVTDTQVKKGTKCELKGSWEPDDVWGADGGRVYATSIMALILETPIRFP